jgi:hypothetical protein
MNKNNLILQAQSIQPKDLQLCPNPVFIIGSPRSGTKILAMSLTQHGHFWTSEESQILWDLFGDGCLEKNYLRQGSLGGSWLHKQGVQKEEFLGYVGIGFNALFSSRSGGKRWIDHTPVYTFLVHSLMDMFPGALFLHILRDGRRVVHSMLHFLNRFGPVAPVSKPTGNNPKWATEFREACRTWSRYVNAAMEFASAYPTRCLTVVNEHLMADPDNGFRAILEFLGAPHDDGPAAFFKSNRVNSSFPQHKQGLAGSPGVSDAWKEWSSERKAIFEEEAAPTQKKYIHPSQLGETAGAPSARLAAT